MVPEHPKAWHHLGQLLTSIGDFGQAASALTRAAELDPENLTCRTQLGHLYRNMSIPEAAIHWHGEALKLQPDSLIFQLNHAFVQALVPNSIEQLNALKKRTLSELSIIEERSDLKKPFSGLIGTCHPFYLMYENSNNVDLMQRYGRLLAHDCSGCGKEQEAKHR
jgi:tetratricopeptide (TPR) repeat protein